MYKRQTLLLCRYRWYQVQICLAKPKILDGPRHGFLLPTSSNGTNDHDEQPRSVPFCSARSSRVKTCPKFHARGRNTQTLHTPTLNIAALYVQPSCVLSLTRYQAKNDVLIGTGPRDMGKVMAFTRKKCYLQVLLRPIKSEL